MVINARPPSQSSVKSWRVTWWQPWHKGNLSSAKVHSNRRQLLHVRKSKFVLKCRLAHFLKYPCEITDCNCVAIVHHYSMGTANFYIRDFFRSRPPNRRESAKSCERICKGYPPLRGILGMECGIADSKPGTSDAVDNVGYSYHAPAPQLLLVPQGLTLMKQESWFVTIIFKNKSRTMTAWNPTGTEQHSLSSPPGIVYRRY